MADLQYYKGRYTIDGETYYNGFDAGQEWNGFECPCFVAVVAEQILRDVCNLNNEVIYKENPYRYALERDTESNGNQSTPTIIKLYDPEYPNEPEVWERTTINLPDGDQADVYHIGAFSWVWDRADS